MPEVGLSGKVKSLATEFGAYEEEHVKALEGLIQQLGAKPAEAAKGKFPLKDEASFLKVAVTLEEVGVSAYNGVAPALHTPDLIAAAGSIVQVEARHAGALRMVAGQDPAPLAFDKPLTAREVGARVKRYVGP